MGGGGGLVFFPVPQILELIVEVVALSELQVVERIQEQWRWSSSSLTSRWTFQSATETGLLRRASDSVHETERRHDVTSPKLFHLIFSTRKAT